MTFSDLLEQRLLPSLPRRLSRFGYDMMRAIGLRKLHSAIAGRPVALLATHDLSLSGAPRIVLEVARILQQYNYALVLVTMADGPMRSEFEALGATILVDCFPNAKKQYLRKLAERSEFAIANTIVTSKIALAWAHSVKTFWYLHEVSLLKARLADKSVVKSLRAVSVVWAGSDLCAQIVKHVRADVSVFPYGIAPVDPPAETNVDPYFRIGVFGSIESRKGQDYVVEAVRMLDDVTRAGIKVDIFGRTLEPGYAQKIKALAENFPMIQFHDEINREEYLRSIRGCDAVLVSSRDDTLPLVSLDALSSKRMLLLAPSVGTAAWLTDGVNVLVANETSSAGICLLLQRALAERTNKVAIGNAGRQAFDCNFSEGAFRHRMIVALGIDKFVQKAEY